MLYWNHEKAKKVSVLGQNKRSYKYTCKTKKPEKNSKCSLYIQFLLSYRYVLQMGIT